MAAMPRETEKRMSLIDPPYDMTEEHNRLQLKHLKARAQIAEALALLLMLVVLAVIIAPVIALIVWLV